MILKTFLITIIILIISNQRLFPTGLFYNDLKCSEEPGVRQYKENYCAQRIKGKIMNKKKD
jgi:hypothetical protein